MIRYNFAHIFQVLLLCFAFSFATFAQNAITITAVIADSKGNLLEGDVLAMSAKDMNLLKGNLIAKGQLQLQLSRVEIPTNEFLLKIICLGFADTTLLVKTSPTINSYDFGTITVKESSIALAAVEVVAKPPIFKKNDEGTVMNVANTVLASSVSTSELLARSPSVIVSGNTLQLFGKGEALIYLNGKQIAFERLASIPVNLIKEVQIITNPSAKYDARGRGVINIITKEDNTQGLLGVLTQNFTAARHYINTTALNLSYRTGKFVMSADGSLLSGTDWFNNTLSSQANYNGDVYTNYNYYEANNRQPYVANYKFGFGYEINKKSDISLQYDGLIGLREQAMATNARIVTPRNEPIFIKTFNNGIMTNKNNSLNINYNYKLDTLGSTLFVGGQYNFFNTITYDQIAEDIAKGNAEAQKNHRINDGKNDISLFTMQVDVVKKLKKNRRFEFGAKYSSVVNDGTVAFMSRKEGSETWVSFPQFSNSFLYNEKIPAGYIQYAGNFSDKFNFSLGLRAETSIIQGLSRKLNKTVLDTTYLNLFPNLKLNYQFSEHLSMNATYSRRINRPQYQNIDPFVWYQDSLTSFQGNTKLTAELVNSYEATLFYKAFSLKFGYAHSDNVLRAVLITGNTGLNSFIFTIANLQKFRQYSATLELPFDTKYWSSYNSINFNLNQFFDDRPEFKMSMPVTPMWYFYLYQQFKIPNIINIDLIGEYTSSQSDAITSRDPLYQVSVGVSRAFLQNKLNVRLVSNDIFRTQQWSGERAFGNIYATYNQRFNTHFTRLTVSYKFGKLKASGYKNKAVNEEQYNRIKR